MIKTCLICQTSFESQTRAVTCSQECWEKHRNAKNRKWTQQNPEKAKAQYKETRTRRHENGKATAYQKTRRSSKAGYLDRFMERIRVEHPASDITRDYLESLFGDVCAVCGVPFVFERTGGGAFTNPYAPSIDRIDSAIPYQRGNIQIVLSTINFAKNAAPMPVFIQVWKDITASWSALVD